MGKPWVPMPILEDGHRIHSRPVRSTEDLPLADNRVHLNSSGQICLTRRETNLAAHHELIKRMKKVVRKAGFPFVLTRSLGVEATSHQCGTARMGDDPTTSVVDAEPAGTRSGQPMDRRQFAVPVLGGRQPSDHRLRTGAATGPIRCTDRLGDRIRDFNR